MNPNTPHEIWTRDHCLGHQVGLETDCTAILTKIIYGSSGIHVFIMLDMNHNVEVPLHGVSLAVALWPHDICKGPERRKNLNLFIPNTMIGTCCVLSTVLMRTRPLTPWSCMLVRGGREKKTAGSYQRSLQLQIT